MIVATILLHGTVALLTAAAARAATISTIITTTIHYAATPINERRALSETLTTTKTYGGAPAVRTVTRTIYADNPLPTVTYFCDNMPRICENTELSLNMPPGIDAETVWYYDSTMMDGNEQRRGGVCEQPDTLLCVFRWWCSGQFSDYKDWPSTCDESPPASFLQGGIGARTQCASAREQARQATLLGKVSSLKDSEGRLYNNQNDAAYAVVVRTSHFGVQANPLAYGVIDAGGAVQLTGAHRYTATGPPQGATAAAPITTWNGLYKIGPQKYSCANNEVQGVTVPAGANINVGPAVYPTPATVSTAPSIAPTPTTPPTTPPVTTGGGGGGSPAPAPIPAPHGGPPIIPALIPLLLLPGPGVPDFGSWNGGRGAAAGSSCVNDGATKVVGLRAPEATKGAILCNSDDFKATMEAAEGSGYFRLRTLNGPSTFVGYQTKPQDVDGCSGISAVGGTNLSETTWVIDCDTQRVFPFNDGDFQVQAAVDIGLMIPLAGENIDDVQCYQSKVEVPVWTDAYWTLYPGTTVPAGAVAECSGVPLRRGEMAEPRLSLSVQPTLSATATLSAKPTPSTHRHHRW